PSIRATILSPPYFLELIQKTPDPKELNRLVKKEFKLYRAAGRTGNRHTLFTGYFEPIYQASLTRNKTFKYPIYRKPDSLITIELSDFNRKYGGDKIVARIEGDKVLPYYTRKQIEFKNILRNKGLEIAWLRDTVDVAFLHIQGSGRLTLPGGKMLSVGYHASNGRPYQSIGKYMLDKGYLDREEMSMQSIRKYLRTHPGVINRVLNYNPSYVFFRKRENGPFGNINVPLTPGRSMALNSRLFPKGALCFISTDKPVVDKDGKITEWVGFSRFVMNQDTGGAITGAGRADIFWGSGQYAEIAAGHLKHEGELYILIKKSFK
ncbi:murein transglycosylase A, partial [Thermodesulfobacteriota bacterium]